MSDDRGCRFLGQTDHSPIDPRVNRLGGNDRRENGAALFRRERLRRQGHVEADGRIGIGGQRKRHAGQALPRRSEPLSRRHACRCHPGDRLRPDTVSTPCSIVGWAHAPDPPPILSLVPDDAVAHLRSDKVGMLDPTPIEVTDPQRPIRAGHREHRPEPGIARGEELAHLLAGRPAGLEGHADRDELATMDDVEQRLADIRTSAWGEARAPIDRQPAAGIEGVGGLAVERRRRAADGEKSVLLHRIFEHLHVARRRREGMAAGDVEREDDLADRRRVPIAEPVSLRVKSQAELRKSCHGLDLTGVGAEAEIVTIDRDGRDVGALRRRDRAATPPVGGIHPAIRAGAEAVDTELLIAGLESGEDHLAELGRSVAVPVDKVENVGGRGDEEPAIPCQKSVGKGEPSGEDRPRIDRSVAVGVGEGDDPSTAVAVGIVAHLGDEQPAIVIPADRHRIEDERFGRHKLHDMPRHDVEAGQRGGR